MAIKSKLPVKIMNNKPPIAAIASTTQQRHQLTDEQTLALVQALRRVVQQETSTTTEAASICMGTMVTFMMDLRGDNIELVAKELKKISKRIVSDFRSGKFRMQRAS